jgi:hypothetical protein
MLRVIDYQLRVLYEVHTAGDICEECFNKLSKSISGVLFLVRSKKELSPEKDGI